MTNIAYHFTGRTLRDGQPIPPIGETLVYDGPLVMSIHPLDALRHAPGPLLHRVQLSGKILTTDKLCAYERTIIASIEATDLLRRFACWCALRVIRYWTASSVVREYLNTECEELREAAWKAAVKAETAAWVAEWAAEEEAWVVTEAEAAVWEAGAMAWAAGAAAWAATWAVGAAVWAAAEAAEAEAWAAARVAWEMGSAEEARVAAEVARVAAKASQREKFAEMVRGAFS